MSDMNNMDYSNPNIVDTKQETDKKCPACGGVMSFNPQTGGLGCVYCGYVEEIKVQNPGFVAQELDFSSVVDDAACEWGTATKTVLCKSCGAETIYDANDIANTCPYCGSNQVMEAAGENTLAPSGVVPFIIDAKKAAALFKKWIGGKFFCPNQAKESAKADAFKGLYIPFWTFDSQTESGYTAQYGIDYKVKDKDGKYVTETKWYNTSGHHSEFFDDVLVCGSSKQKEYDLESLEPYDTTKVVEYKPEYMAGFVAERYTVKVKDAWERAKQKIKSLIRGNIESEVKYHNGADRVRSVDFRTDYRNTTYKYLLLPVWISSFKYNGKVYQFKINGQTGKVTGQTPISWIKVGLVALGAALIVGAYFYFTKNGDSVSLEMMRYFI